MLLKDLMTTGLITIAPSSTIQTAAAEMEKWDIGALPVCEGSRTVGIITDRDLVIRAMAQGLDAKQTLVQDVMTQGVTSCPAGYDIQEAARLMKDQKIRRLIIEDTNKRPVGIVSLGDLALYTRKGEISEEVLEEVSKPGPNHVEEVKLKKKTA